ncbi:hypothetical protein Runsl_5699 (plasmid) [Runella slithyformis DSM 19594]|uniref:Uncharacterized protein n=1 Tax=Runella slithyformis (strain ATCC 29530 / DSM 19594 / LMG 11500 / NCIMB 11436 / LSU 4) TaxID=761193 RepID=A0A7U3ZRE8_RUNSL|nr:hypothetical protein Runsl_5699 [Runella slithyformis DSM 19594]
MLKYCLVDGVVADIWVHALIDGDFLYLLGTVRVEFMAVAPLQAMVCQKMDG